MVFEFDIYDVVLVSTLVDAELKRCTPCKCLYASKGDCSVCDYRKHLFNLKDKIKTMKTLAFSDSLLGNAKREWLSAKCITFKFSVYATQSKNSK